MIRLFRKIRQQLLSEDKYSIYVLYAGGEILLVVIGILIALQLDNRNDKRKQELAGEELSSRLYQELLTIREYNVQKLEDFQWQYKIIDRILEQGTRLDVDSLIAATQDYWAIQTFTLTTYIFSFTEFYDPDVKLYKSSVADGSIKLIKDEIFISDLEEIYITGKYRLDKLYDREITSNKSLENHMVENYAALFKDHSNIVEGNWDTNTVKASLVAILDDGAFRFILQKKLGQLKSKIDILEREIMSSVEKAINLYEQ
jgi:hypothetical protein